jgi:DNA repair protein RecO (recombination protein O)
MALSKTKAFVLKKIDFRETSVIVRFFSQDFGKISCLFKGIRTEPKKFASTLEPFSLNEVIFYQGTKNELHIASQSDAIDSYQLLRCDLSKVQAATSMLSLVDSLMQPQQAHEPTFFLLKECLDRLEKEPDWEKLVYIFKIKILSCSGFQPHIDSCVSCSAQIGYSQRAYFSSAYGGLLCQKCLSAEKTARPMYRGTLASLQFIQKSNLDEALRLGFNTVIRKELSSLLNTFLQYHLEKELKAFSYV